MRYVTEDGWRVDAIDVSLPALGEIAGEQLRVSYFGWYVGTARTCAELARFPFDLADLREV